eukprot:GFUD01026435.1.p1 GENE.GFUD01026435.1~~GFUD01026435.1.p1  ORF type:complete len:343 (-),score=95.54 GFUD01026435.1:79-1107(-)
MPGKSKKGGKKNKHAKKQFGDAKQDNNTTEENPAPTPGKMNLNDAFLEQDVVVMNVARNNNQSKDARVSFDSFVSNFDVGEQVKSQRVRSTNKIVQEQPSKLKTDFSHLSNNNVSGTKNRNLSTKNNEANENSSAGDLKTVEDYIALGISPEIVMMKHPLEHPWVFWWFRNDKNRTWEQNQERIATVETIEDFWQIYNYIEPASQLGSGCDYAVFKRGIQPDWEDFQNMAGGRWIINSEKSNRGDVLDNYWLETILILIGEHAGEFAGMVNGAVINIRPRADKLAVWLRDAGNMAGVMEIGRLVKSRLGLGSRINFTVHREDRGTRTRFGSGGQNSPSKIFV